MYKDKASDKRKHTKLEKERTNTYHTTTLQSHMIPTACTSLVIIKMRSGVLPQACAYTVRITDTLQQHIKSL